MPQDWRAAAAQKAPYSGAQYEHKSIYMVQPLVITDGPFAGRICENDDDDFIVEEDSYFNDLLEEYSLGGDVRYVIGDEDQEKIYGIPCQVVYFGSPLYSMALDTYSAIIPNSALKPANTNDLVERLESISREIFKYVGLGKAPGSEEWAEAFSREQERSLILSELWEREVLLRTKPSSSKNVFLCHASADKGTVRRVAADLRTLGHNIWLDEFEIKVGDSIVEKISLGTQRAHALVLFVSRASSSSTWVQREWQSTLGRQLSGKSVLIIPAKIEECELPAIMADIRYADFVENYRAGIDQIATALATIGED
jgi:hypothetical protein